MNSKQISIASMLRRTLDLIKKNLRLLSGLPVFIELCNLYEANLTEIDTLAEYQEKDITGLAKQKEVHHADANRKALDMSRRVVAFAKLTGNEVLAKEAYYTETELKHLSADIFVNDCMIIYNAAVTNALALTEYGVTTETLSALKASIDTFKGVMDKPKEATTGKKQSTDKLADLINSALAVLAKIDLLVDILKDTHPDFYAEYYDTRKVVYRSSSLAVNGWITDATTASPLSGATVNFALNGVVCLEKTTADGGGFAVKSMDEGVYDVTISKIGYKTVKQTFTIAAAELATLEVPLEKN